MAESYAHAIPGQGSVKADPSDAATEPTTVSDMDDDISVTSTVYPDESDDHEYEVDDILYEEVDASGVMKYLVRWKNYPLEMCTWEPKENFAPELLEDVWEQKKQKPGFQPFDRSLLDEAHRAKSLRHVSRNRKRKRLGLPETSPFIEAVSYTPDNDVSDRDISTEESSVVVSGPPVASPVMATTEIHDLEDDLMVVESLSAPPQRKKKKKKNIVDLTTEETTIVVAKKKKKNANEDNAKEKGKDKDLDVGKHKRKDSDKTAGKGLDKERPHPKLDDDHRKKKSPPDAAHPGNKPTQKVSESANKRKVSIDAFKKVVESLGQRKKSTDSSSTLSTIRTSSSSTSVGTVPRVDSKGKLPEKKASPDRVDKTATSSSTSSVSEARSSTSQNASAPFSEKLAKRAAKTSKSSAVPLAKELPIPKKAGPSKGINGSSSSTPAAATAATAPVALAALRPTNALLAKKTGPTSQDTGGNAFSSGKRVRTGRTLGVAMTDPNKPQQLFEKRSILRRAELYERDKADRAIEPSQLKTALFPISKGPPAGAGAGALPAPPWSSATAGAPKDLSTGPIPQAAPSRPSLKRPSVGEAPTRRKSVRFADIDGNEIGLLLGRTRLKSPPVPRSGSAEESGADEDSAMYLEPQDVNEAPAPTTLPPVSIKALFGAQREPVAATLDVVAEEGGSQQLLDQIFTGRTLRFAHSILAATLQQQLNAIRKQNLFSGNVKLPCPTDAAPATSSSASILQTVSQRLKLMASGVILLEPEHAVLIYPTQCEEWAESKYGFPDPAEIDSTTALRYVVFSTYADCAALLRPAGESSASSKPLSDGHERQQLVERFFQLGRDSYLDLLPDYTRLQTSGTHFFLAFPPTEKPFMFQMALWLREMDENCAILFSTHPGSWMSFMHHVEKLKRPGVVIVHEMVTGAVRRFPYLRRLVYPGAWNCRLWSISQGAYPSPIFYPILGLSNDSDDITSLTPDLANIGRISWTELFPSGLAILLTPSVILSQPIHVYNILRWVSAAARSGKAPVTLVAAWGLCAYLKEIAHEKYQACEEIRTGQTKTHASSKANREARRVPASLRECVHRHESWVLASELSDEEGQQALSGMRGAHWPKAVTFADPAIDPNDEQSLVNWFGWWSTIYMDQYRAFYVIGSQSKGLDPDSMSRKIRVPNFAPTTVSDPDKERENALAPAASMEGDDGKSPTKMQSTRRPSATDSQRPLRPAVRRHSALPLTLYTSKLMSFNKWGNFWKVFGFIVLWRDAAESFSHGTMDSSNHTIPDWFKYTWPFNEHHRSYIGLFNLVDDLDEEPRTADSNAGTSHPWVVIWRPVNPHKMEQLKETELIFWDARAGGNIHRHDVLYEQEVLTSGQQAVVDYVRQHGSEKNPGTHLKYVSINSRIRSWAHEPSSPRYNALDRTMAYLEELAADFRYVMPPTAIHLRSLGYRPLMPGRRETGTSTATSTVSTPTTVASVPAEIVDDGMTSGIKQQPGSPRPAMETTERPRPPERMVFHPPSGSRLGPSGSWCRNDLFENAQVLKKRNPGATEMNYEFRPTMEWYGEQVEEGRGFEHVSVEGVEEVCALFGIPTRSKE